MEENNSQSQAGLTYYYDYSIEQLEEEKTKLEEDLEIWTRMFENPTRPEQKSDAWIDIKYTNMKLDFVNKVLDEKKIVKR